jgi:hypothetical protein
MELRFQQAMRRERRRLTPQIQGAAAGPPPAFKVLLLPF